MLNLIVCGGRNYRNEAVVWSVLDRCHRDRKIDFLAEGAQTGADTLAYRWRIRKKVPGKRFEAAWHRFGRSAGPIRNREMWNEVHPQLVIAFPSVDNQGTADMVDIAKNKCEVWMVSETKSIVEPILIKVLPRQGLLF